MATTDITSLPPRVWSKICSFLPLASILATARVSKATKAQSSQDPLWKELCTRDFAEEFDEVTASSISSWKQFYQCKYLLALGWKKGEVRSVTNIHAGGGAFFAIDGDRLIYKLGEAIQISRISSGQLMLRIEGPPNDTGFRFLQYSLASKRIVRVTRGENVYIYDSESGSQLHRIPIIRQIVQLHLEGSMLFVLTRNKNHKTNQLDVWSLETNKVIFSTNPAYRSRFCVQRHLLIITEVKALKVFEVGSWTAAVNIPTAQPVRAVKHTTASDREIVLVVKVAPERYEIQIIDSQHRALEWTLYSSHSPKSIVIDSWKLVVGFVEYVRVFDLRKRKLLLHLAKEVSSSSSKSATSTEMYVTDASIEFFSIFAATCIDLDSTRLFVKFPSVPHIIAYDFSMPSELFDGISASVIAAAKSSPLQSTIKKQPSSSSVPTSTPSSSSNTIAAEPSAAESSSSSKGGVAMPAASSALPARAPPNRRPSLPPNDEDDDYEEVSSWWDYSYGEKKPTSSNTKPEQITIDFSLEDF